MEQPPSSPSKQTPKHFNKLWRTIQNLHKLLQSRQNPHYGKPCNTRFQSQNFALNIIIAHMHKKTSILFIPENVYTIYINDTAFQIETSILIIIISPVLFVCCLTSQSTTMIMSRQSADLSTHFSWAGLDLSG